MSRGVPVIVLEAIRVWNWRGLDAFALEGLAPDLNLVVGPNESGKSRLFEALRHALFERYKGQGYGRPALQGWASHEPPEVEVVFRADGHRYTVRKRFLRREFAHLEGGGQTWRDDEAEARLREILGTRDHDRVLRPEHLGIWPVLWLGQGRAGLAPHEDLHPDGRARIHDALAAEVDEVAAGPRGQAVVERVSAEYLRYWQPARGLAAGELKAAREGAEAADLALQAATARREAARAHADESSAVTERLAGLAPRLGALRDASAAATAREQAAREAATAIEVHEARVAQRRALADEADRARDERRRWEAEAARLDADRGALAAEVTRLEVDRAAADEALGAAADAVADADGVEEASAARVAKAAQHARRRETARVAEQKLEALKSARSLSKAVEDAAKTLRECEIAPLTVQRLRKAEEAHRLATARREAASVLVEVHALRAVVIDGEALPAGATRSWRLDRARRIGVDDAVEIAVTPGEGLLGKLADAERDAAAELSRLLAEHGVSSVEESDDRLERTTKTREGLQHLEARLRQAAPAGVEALQREADDATQRLADLDGPVLALPLAADAPIDRDAADAAHRIARDALIAARARRDMRATQAGKAREACAVANARLEALHAEHQGVADRLASLRPAAVLQGAADAARVEWSEAHAVLESLRRRWQAEGGAGAADEAEQARRALDTVERQHGELVRQAADLRAKLEVHGGDRLHEDVLDAQAALDAARADAERIERRALAARRLKEALDTARQRAQERLLAPVRARVEPYLDEMFPGSGLDLDESWAVRGLRTGDTAEAFDLLSGGAREQLSVIVRLGLAEVLGDGERLPVVLDDALVNSDPARLARMLKVLYRAAKRLQVVVFTCHEVAFDGLGATRVFRLGGRAREVAAERSEAL